MSFKCECYIIMQAQYTKSLNHREIGIGHNIKLANWSIVYFPGKLGLKIHTFLTLMGTNLTKGSYSRVN